MKKFPIKNSQTKDRRYLSRQVPRRVRRRLGGMEEIWCEGGIPARARSQRAAGAAQE